MEQRRRTTFGDGRGALDDEVELHAPLFAVGLYRERHPGVPLDVRHLLIAHQLADHDLVAVEPYPHDRVWGRPSVAIVVK